mmetsp:Transcript_53159/g.108429  ORF Transcript_53159/g.108429 Transcript_53159/m.108429 type:complete len:80 (-) Transcript_53159:4-243(-)
MSLRGFYSDTASQIRLINVSAYATHQDKGGNAEQCIEKIRHPTRQIPSHAFLPARVEILRDVFRPAVLVSTAGVNNHSC